MSLSNLCPAPDLQVNLRVLASTLRHSDATLQQERTQLIDERCPLRNQAPAHAMQ
jgi:hypothetical protein